MDREHRYDPSKHHRRSIRMKGYDYAQPGYYFITICCYQFQCRFGAVRQGEMILNEFGRIAHDEWQALPGRFAEIELDAFQIMPNHLHGILIIRDPNSKSGAFPPVQAPLAGAPINEAFATDEFDASKGAGASPAHTAREGATESYVLGNIVGAYKSLVLNRCLAIYKSRNEQMGRFWHRNYYEHIIRNEPDYQRIATYIYNNPSKWEQDRLRR